MNHIMKLNRIVTALFLMLALTGIAQDTDNETRLNNHYFSLTFGLNMMDNSNGSILPFDGNPLNFNTPFFLTAENKFHKNWSLAFMLSTNQLTLNNTTAVEPYFSTDVFANLFIDDLVFNNENIDLYVGLGAGIHTVQGNAAGSFNVSGGFRYWVSEKVGINLQAIGKINNDGIAQVDNHYQFNMGVTYRFGRKAQNSLDTENAMPIEPVVNATDRTKVAIEPVKPITQDPTEFSLDADKDVKKPITVTSTDLAKDAYEADQIKKNVGALLNTKSSNTMPDGVNKGYHVIVYAFEYKNNLDRMVRLLTDNGIKVQVIRVADKNLDYISVAYFNTSEEAHNYMDTKLDKELFKDSWVYVVD
jgi:hypothetical protein